MWPSTARQAKKYFMTKPEKEQLDRLLSEITDEGLSADRISRLEAMLMNRPDLQAYYTDATTVQSLMRYELKGNLGLMQPLVGVPVAGTGSLSTDQQTQSTPQRPTDRDLPASKARSFWVLLAALAAAVLFVATTAFHTRQQPNDSPLAKQGSSLPGAASTPGAEALSSSDSPTIEMTDTRQLATLSRVIRTDTITRVLLPADRVGNGQPKSDRRLVGGNVWIDRSPIGRERGYVVALAPGYRMDVRLDSDAGSQNALGIVELDSQGNLTGDMLSFNNIGATTEFADRRYGNIGEFSVTNEESTVRFFLIAGSHLDPGGQWRQSDYKLLHESSNFLVLGWDDSGYPGTEPVEDGRDRDFNDVSTILHFSPLVATDDAQREGITFAPPALAETRQFDGEGAGYLLDVTPGQHLLMLVSSSALKQNTMVVVDHDTRQVIWQNEKPEMPEGDILHETTTRGVYVIHNQSPTVKRYEFHVRSRDVNAEGDTSWLEFPSRVNGQEDHWELIGFEDSPNDPAMLDWNDVQVHARWFDK